MIRQIIEEALTITCLLLFLIAVYLWSNEIGAFIYD